MNKFWNFFAIFGVSPDIDCVSKIAVTLIVSIFILIQILAAGSNRANYEKIEKYQFNQLNSHFYTYLLYYPAIFLLASVELLILIVCSANIIVFTLMCIFLLVYNIIKAINTEGGNSYSLLEITTYIQSKVIKYIVVERHHYPFQPIIERYKASRKILKQQNKYLYERNS